MVRRILLGSLVVCVALAAGLWFTRPTPCGRPIAYRLGTVDGRFGLTNAEVLEALREAESLWGRAVGRDVFTHDPRATLTVTLVYDERQQTTQTSQRLWSSMQQAQASHAVVSRSYAEWRETYERRARSYETTYAAYQERAAARTPLGRLGRSIDIAAAIVSLLSLEWVTGQVLVADGGLSLYSPIDPMEALEQ